MKADTRPRQYCSTLGAYGLPTLFGAVLVEPLPDALLLLLDAIDRNASQQKLPTPLPPNSGT